MALSAMIPAIDRFALRLGAQSLPPAVPLSLRELAQRTAACFCCRRIPQRIADEPIEAMPIPANAAERTVDLGTVRQQLMAGDLPENLDRFAPLDFVELIDEFPGYKETLSRWAVAWARRRPLVQDPAHAYAEIFQEMLRWRGELGIGEGRVLRIEADHQHDRDHSPAHQNASETLLAFQELTRPDHRLLIQKLDNGVSWRDPGAIPRANPAHSYIWALGKMPLLPFSTFDFIQNSFDVPWEAYQRAKKEKRTLQFFYAFQDPYHYHFENRVFQLKEFIKRVHYDFLVQPTAHPDEMGVVLEYHRVFENRQLEAYCRLNHLDFEVFRDIVRKGKHEHAALIRDFRRDFLNEGQFQLFLKKMKRECHPMLLNGKAIPQERWKSILRFWRIFP